MASIWILPVIASILIFTLVLSQNTEALKSEGNSLTEVSSNSDISSDQVCGDKICESSMTIENKIEQYLNERRGNDSADVELMLLVEQRINEISQDIIILSQELEELKTMFGSESTVLQQALDFRFTLNEPLSDKQLEQAKVRQFVPTTPSKIPSAKKSIDEMFSGGLSEPIGLPCLDCITADFIAPDAVGASEIAANAVGASEIAPNAVRGSELYMSLKAFSAYNKDGGIQTREVQMVPNNGKNFCGLVKVKMENLDNSMEFDSFKTAMGALIGTVGGPLGIFAGGAAGTAASLAASGAATLITSSGGVSIVSNALDAADFIVAMSGNEAAECDINVGGRDYWVLQASLSDPNKDANVYCQALCVSYP